MAKPIANMRDYNGTYAGTPGTGSAYPVYSTLYRDNYDNGQLSGCIGEGCGSHPGVDIAVTQNTNVYAALSGIVVWSTCDWNGSRLAPGTPGGSTGWGGVVVIRSNNPYISGRYVYFIYGHLNNRYVAQNDSVSTGQLIGLSGGNLSNGACPGASTNDHLHFQVDRDPVDTGHSVPYFPSGNISSPDTTYTISQYTYNPIVFVMGGYRWTFEEGSPTNNREYWDIFNLQSWGMVSGSLWMDGWNDPYIQRSGLTNCGKSVSCSSSVSAEPELYKKIHLYMYNNCVNNPLKVYFKSKNFNSWSETYTQGYNIGYGWNDIHVDMSGNYYWNNGGVINGIRVDPAQSCSSGSDPTYFYNITIER